MSHKIEIPVVDEQDLIQKEFPKSSCSADEPYVLMVLGDSMMPEFEEGEVILIDPNAAPRDGSFVVAKQGDEHTFRQLRILGEDWYLTALNDLYPSEPVRQEAVVGVVTQKNRPGTGRKGRKFYT